MNTWSAAFAAYINARALSAIEVAEALEVPASSVSYWRRGIMIPRAATRRRIARWSKGAVPAALGDEGRASIKA